MEDFENVSSFILSKEVNINKCVLWVGGAYKFNSLLFVLYNRCTLSNWFISRWLLNFTV